MNNPLPAYNDLIKENDSIYRALYKRLGLSACTFWILYTLREEQNSITQTEICEILHEPKQTVNSALKSLEAEGYIILSYGQDRRSKCVMLTEKGICLARKTVDAVMLAEQSALLALSEQERAMFLSLFRKYTEILKDKTKEIGGAK
ncbi:MAG: winged helix DNA-binding protein [Clostridiales bacterium]|jgi:DNA-binding MarR family transcriptional regulator|nr:winged helix DNA-binding protein [Clostridiales bacterium]